MADTHCNDVLGDLLIDLSRCLLQYVGEGWPWTAGDESEQQIIDELVARQKQGVARLAELLSSRRVSIDFGTYPTDYTDLQYLALDHLLGQLVVSQQALVDLFGYATTNCAADRQAVVIVEDIHAAERDNLSQLQVLAAKPKSDNAA